MSVCVINFSLYDFLGLCYNGLINNVIAFRLYHVVEVITFYQLLLRLVAVKVLPIIIKMKLTNYASYTIVLSFAAFDPLS